MNEQYSFVRILGLDKEVPNLSLVVTEVSQGGVMTAWGGDARLYLSTSKRLEQE